MKKQIDIKGIMQWALMFYFLVICGLIKGDILTNPFRIGILVFLGIGIALLSSGKK